MDDSEFRTWFESQFGKPPSGMPLVDLIENAIDAEYKFRELDSLYKMASIYETKRSAALLAWQVKHE